MDWDAWDGNHWYSYQNFSLTCCVKEFAFGGGYYDATAGGDASYAITALNCGYSNDQTNSWSSHGVFVR